jgi:hypothetical protein
MYIDQGGGSVELQGITCYLPKQPPWRKISGINLPIEKQKWYPTPLPRIKAKNIKIFSGEKYDPEDLLSWEQCEREEIIGMSGHDPWDIDRNGNPKKIKGVEPDINYRCQKMSEFREQELDRLENGYWFMLKGKPTYITGIVYIYFNWWQMDIGLPNYRDYIRELGYVIEVVKDIPIAVGLILASMRGIGKSYFAACVIYCLTIQKKYAKSGIQSKGDDDAASLFRNKLCDPISKLPSFLVPIHTWGKTMPVEKLEFEPPRKGHPNFRYDKWLRERAIRSTIDYKNAKDNAYDGETTTVLLQDEIGKIDKKVGSVKERFRIARFCVFRGSVKRGILFGFTTVGGMERGGGDEFKEVYRTSNQNDPEMVDESGWTLSGCYRYFISALDATIFDDYGIADKEAARKYHDIKRASIYADCMKNGDMGNYISYCQNNPYTEEEAFMISGKDCIFNAAVLQDRQMNISVADTRRGDFEWEITDEKARWVDNPVNGKVWVSKFPDGKIWVPNNVLVRNNFTGRSFFPNYERFGRGGADPISHKHLIQKSRGSDATFTLRSLFIYNWLEEFCNVPIVHYCGRPLDPEESFEDYIKIMFFYSVPALIENQKIAAINYIEKRGYGGFIMKRPESTFTMKGRAQDTPGVPNSEPMMEYGLNLAKTDINKNGYKFKHQHIVQDCLALDPMNTKKFDSFMSYMYSLIASEKPAEEPAKEVDVTGLYTMFNHNKKPQSIR